MGKEESRPQNFISGENHRYIAMDGLISVMMSHCKYARSAMTGYMAANANKTMKKQGETNFREREVIMNHTKEIAEILGLEIGEKFRIKGHPDMGTFWFVDDDSCGLKDLWQCEFGPRLYDEFESANDLLEQILTGFYEVEKLPWKPECHYFYYYVIGGPKCAHVDSNVWLGTIGDLTNWSSGNCFKTMEEAQAKSDEMYEKLRKEFEEA